MHEQLTLSETQRIPLQRRDGEIVAYAIVDAADHEWLSQWTWRLSGDGYAMRSERQNGRCRPIRMHRLILGLGMNDPREGDHRNRNRLDYRRTNLRIAERGAKDNQQNKPSYAGSSSQYRGVSWARRQRKWVARVRLDGKLHYLGYFADEDEAGAVASAWRAKHMPFSEDAAA